MELNEEDGIGCLGHQQLFSTISAHHRKEVKRDPGSARMSIDVPSFRDAATTRKRQIQR